MAVTEDKLKDAVAKIETVSSALHSHIGAQTVINIQVAENTRDIVTLKINEEKRNGDIMAVSKDVGRILTILGDRQNKVIAWIGALTPWAFVLCGFVYFYVTKNGGTP